MSDEVVNNLRIYPGGICDSTEGGTDSDTIMCNERQVDGMVVDLVVILGMVVVDILELEAAFVDLNKRHLQLHSTRI